MHKKVKSILQNIFDLFYSFYSSLQIANMSSSEWVKNYLLFFFYAQLHVFIQWHIIDLIIIAYLLNTNKIRELFESLFFISIPYALDLICRQRIIIIFSFSFSHQC